MRYDEAKKIAWQYAWMAADSASLGIEQYSEQDQQKIRAAYDDVLLSLKIKAWGNIVLASGDTSQAGKRRKPTFDEVAK